MTLRKKLLALFIVLAMVMCLLPAAAFAAGSEKPADTAAADTEKADTAKDTVSEDKSAEDGKTETEAEPEETVKDEKDAKTDKADAEKESDKADKAEKDEEVVILTAEKDEVVFNTGICFNNGGVVYNNGGEVYNNSGVCYNNRGVCYVNDGTVYNNNGTVYYNGGTVINNDGEVLKGTVIGDIYVELPENAEVYLDIEGLEETEDGKMRLTADGILTVSAKEGFEILSLECGEGSVEEDDGVYTVSELEASCALSVVAELEAPVIEVESATFSESHEITISAVDGAEIYYTVDGSEPDENSILYKYHFTVDKSCIVKAVAFVEGFGGSPVASEEYAFVEISAPKFDSVELGYEQPAAQPVKIENSGKVNAVIISAELDEKGAEYFELSTESGGEIEAESTDEETWTVRPKEKLEAGMYKATVTFTFDSGDTQSVSVNIKVK